MLHSALDTLNKKSKNATTIFFISLFLFLGFKTAFAQEEKLSNELSPTTLNAFEKFHNIDTELRTFGSRTANLF